MGRARPIKEEKFGGVVAVPQGISSSFLAPAYVDLIPHERARE